MAEKRSGSSKFGTGKRAKKSVDASLKKKQLKPVKRIKKVVKLNTKTVNYSICIPTSVLDNCKNLEQITYTLYQIARTACIFNVAEIVILETEAETTRVSGQSKESKRSKKPVAAKIKFDDDAGAANPTEGTVEKKEPTKKRLSTSMLIATILQYFVTPPYLTNSVFKKDYAKYFTYAKQLPRISTLPFMRYYKENEGRYREGLAIRMGKPGDRGKSKKSFDQTKYINIGAAKNLELKGQLVPVNVRVTVDTVENKVVSPEEAYGDYVGAKSSFGYHVRIAKTFADLFASSPFPQGYTQTVWINSGDFYYDPTAKKSVKIETKIPLIEKVVKPSHEELSQDSAAAVPAANLLSVFGKWSHISSSFQSCKDQFEGASGAFQFFDGQLDLPGASPQGQMRIEDGCTIALTSLALQ